MPTIEELIQKLGDRNTKARLEAANQLAAMGDEALEAVTALMHHKDYTYRRIAAYILGKIKNPVSVEILVEALGDDNSDVRKSAAQALNRIGKPAIPLLIRALGNISKDVRASAVWSLSKMGEMVVEPLVEALFSEVKDVRASAVWALSKVGEPSIEPLVNLINHPEKNVRESAIWGLAKIGRPAVEYLAKMWNVRIGKEMVEGESESDSVDIDDLLQGGENEIKNWIKFMIQQKMPHEDNNTEGEPGEGGSESAAAPVEDGSEANHNESESDSGEEVSTTDDGAAPTEAEAEAEAKVAAEAEAAVENAGAGN